MSSTTPREPEESQHLNRARTEPVPAPLQAPAHSPEQESAGDPAQDLAAVPTEGVPEDSTWARPGDPAGAGLEDSTGGVPGDPTWARPGDPAGGVPEDPAGAGPLAPAGGSAFAAAMEQLTVPAPPLKAPDEPTAAQSSALMETAWLDAAAVDFAAAGESSPVSPASAERDEEEDEGAYFDEEADEDEADEGSGRGAASKKRLKVAPRRRRRRGRIALAVVLVLILALAGAGWGLEMYLRSQVSATVRQGLPGLSQDAQITTEGLITPQILRGTLETLSIDADSLTLESGGGSAPATGGSSITLSEFSVHVTDLSLKAPYTAQEFSGTGTISWDDATSLAAGISTNLPPLTLKPDTLSTDTDPGTILAESSFGVELQVGITPSVTAEGGLLLSVSSITVAGSGLSVDIPDFAVGALTGLTGNESVEIGPELLPAGLKITAVKVTQKGLALTLSGTNVSLGS